MFAGRHVGGTTQSQRSMSPDEQVIGHVVLLDWCPPSVWSHTIAGLSVAAGASIGQRKLFAKPRRLGAGGAQG